MCAAVWSVPYRQALAFPVQMLIRFWVNHHLLDILQRPLWRVLRGRGEAYVKEVLKSISSVRTSTPVQSVSVRTANGGGMPYPRTDCMSLAHLALQNYPCRTRSMDSALISYKLYVDAHVRTSEPDTTTAQVGLEANHDLP